jgi:hypothetical protein
MFFMRLLKNLQTGFRMLRNIVTRPFYMLNSRISNFLNLSSVAKPLQKIQSIFSDFIKGLKVKPEKRADFVDVGTVYVAKKLIGLLLLLLIALVVFIYFFAWPFFVSNFLTAKFYVRQPGASTYTGKAEIYYDKKLSNLEYRGRLAKGAYTGDSLLCYKNGATAYDGGFVQSKFDGTGTRYSSDGKQIYTGAFKAGKYSGQGALLLSQTLTYKGAFAGGKPSGKGQIFRGKVLVYDGDIKDGMKKGSGKAYYNDGRLRYSGAFDNDAFDGDGTEYDDKTGRVKYKGAFKGGLYSGKGSLYDNKGTLLYAGDFVNGKYDGNGRVYSGTGRLIYEGAFSNGLYDGTGKLIVKFGSDWYEGSFTQGSENGAGKLYRNGQLYYDGNFANGGLCGAGKLNDTDADFEYDGDFENNDIAYGGLFKQKIAKIYGFFVNGMTEDTVKSDAFYLYSESYGAVLKLSYASGDTPAALKEAYTLPVNTAFSTVKAFSDIKLSSGFKKGSADLETPDATICGYLSLNSTVMKAFHILFDGYGICYYTDSATGKILLIKYYPAATEKNKTQTGASQTNQSSAGGRSTGGRSTGGSATKPAAGASGANAVKTGTSSAGGAKTNDAQAKKTAYYFKDVGLRVSDFHSLGY